LLKVVRPKGPYLLGGYCSGNLVAFELARQLCAAGERVDNVVLVDLPHPDRIALRAKLFPFVLRIRRFAESPNKRGALRRRVLMLRALLDPSRAGGHVQAEQTTEAIKQLWQSISERYVPRTYAGRVTLLIAEDDKRYEYMNVKAWPATAPRVMIRSILGSHNSCITDHIDATAAGLQPPHR
jgi:thioesterase domain-containing protein